MKPYVSDTQRMQLAGRGLGSNVTHMPDVRDAIALWDDAYIPGLKKLASRVKKMVP